MFEGDLEMRDGWEQIIIYGENIKWKGGNGFKCSRRYICGTSHDPRLAF